MKKLLSKILLLLAVSLCAHTELANAAEESLLLTAEGKVEVSRGGAAWSAVQTNSVLRTGDRLRTGLRSRAVVRLANLSVVRVNEFCRSG